MAEQQSTACVAEEQLHEIAEQQFEAGPAEQQHEHPLGSRKNQPQDKGRRILARKTRTVVLVMEANFDAKHVDDACQKKSKKKKPRYACLKHMFEKQRLGNDATPPESCSSSYTKTESSVLNSSSSVLMFL